MFSITQLKNWTQNFEIKAFLPRPWVAKILFFLTTVWLCLVCIKDGRDYWYLIHPSTVPIGRATQASSSVFPPALKSNLFGVYVPVHLDEANIKSSSLQVTIVGIVYSTDPLASEVMIKPIAGRERAYHVGDEIPGGAKIKRITSSGILIERDGELERLILQKYKD